MTEGLYDLITRDWRRWHGGFDVDEELPQKNPSYVRGYLDALYRLRDVADAKGSEQAVQTLRELLQ